MNNSVTIQDLQDALMLSMREVKDLRFEITNLRDRLKTDARSIAYYIELEAKLDRMLNNTIDAHEVTKQRLLKYENEAGYNERMNRMQD